MSIGINFIFTSRAHIVGPEIVEPQSAGWVMQDVQNGVVSSIINDIDRASKNPSEFAHGIVYTGSKVFENGTRSAWFGFIGLNGSVMWDLVISDPYLMQGIALQYNKSDQIYFAGHGPSGCMVLVMALNGSQIWNASFGNPGDQVTDMAIIKYDAGYTLNDNGINIAGRFSNGTGYIINLNSSDGSLEDTHVLPSGYQVNSVATDPLLPEIIYMGGKKQINPAEWDGFIMQLNFTTGSVEWNRNLDLSHSSEINEIQVEPVYGGVITVGKVGDDAMIYPFAWYNGADGWNLGNTPYFSYGGIREESATDLVILGESNFMIYVSGSTNSYSAGSTDALCLKIDFNSNLEWEKVWGGMGKEKSTCITAEPGYAVYIGGQKEYLGVIVENPSGTVNIFAKLFGSMDVVVLVMVIFFISIAAVGSVAIIMFLKKRKTKNKQQLDNWIESKKHNE